MEENPNILNTEVDVENAQMIEEEINPTLYHEDELLTLRTENLVKKYGKRTVVNHVSINVNQGEIVGLLGPTGQEKLPLSI